MNEIIIEGLNSQSYRIIEKHPMTDMVPTRLRMEFVIVRRADLPNDHFMKHHLLRGVRVHPSRDAYDLEWWAECELVEAAEKGTD